MISNPEQIVEHLRDFQRQVRSSIIHSRASASMHQVNRSSAADTIYQIDTIVDPLLEEFCQQWGSQTPLILIAEGLEDESGKEGARVFPRRAHEHDAKIRVIVDPIDGTRGLMYDKRSAWALAGVAPNKGDSTKLSDIEIAVMTELPTSKMAESDVLWAIKGQGAHGVRESIDTNPLLAGRPLTLAPSTAANIDHGFASISNFFPGTKILASELMEKIILEMLGEADVTKAMVFDDQYISTGGQLYELIVGHDRFNADLRPLFYQMQNQPPGLCCHPYDCATWLIAAEAGVILTDHFGRSFDGPLDTTTGLSWVGYANRTLANRIGPIIAKFFRTSR